MASFGIKNCERCGKVFSSPRQLCDDCIKQEEKDFETVHHYLRDQPHASIEEVATMTKLDEDLIIKFIKQGRIKSDNINISEGSICQRCGKETLRGNYCIKCLSLLKTETEEAADTLKKNGATTRDSVHTIDRFNTN